MLSFYSTIWRQCYIRLQALLETDVRQNTSLPLLTMKHSNVLLLDSYFDIAYAKELYRVFQNHFKTRCDACDPKHVRQNERAHFDLHFQEIIGLVDEKISLQIWYNSVISAGDVPRDFIEMHKLKHLCKHGLNLKTENIHWRKRTTDMAFRIVALERCFT